MLPYDEAHRHTLEIRTKYDAELEFLIDFLEAPRGFWGHSIGLQQTHLSELREVQP